MTDWQKVESQVMMQVVRRMPATLVRGEGVRAWDDTGKSYLDFMGGWASNALGHCHAVQVEALRRQAEQLVHVTNAFYSVPQLELAQILVEHSVFDRVFFCNSGAEANEGAVKLARKYGRIHRNGAYEVISTLKGFHGRTLAMVAATGKPHYQEPFQPLPAGFVNVEYNSLEAIKAATTDRTCGVLLEPIQGEGGVNVADDDYLRGVRAWCDEKGLVLIMDEVQTGVARTGKLWGYEHSGIRPDIMALAKGIGGGVPLGAILATEQAAAAFAPGDHGSTFGGNPLMCAVGRDVMRYVIDNDLAGHAHRIGQYLVSRLNEFRTEYPGIADIRGRGLLVALELEQERAGEVVNAALAEGLLLNACTPTVIRFMPPLIITEVHVDEAISILDRALARVIERAVAAS
ncbi:MAG: aspartate aminotransferase family protein [Chloroflexi bacterium]|nr:aspartate aminotransferase family protein [Chloroflexota bacterium]